MHSQLWRFLLTLSLLLTLPMQGYAAARMASCDAVLAGALAGALTTEHASPRSVHEMTTGGMHDGSHVTSQSMATYSPHAMAPGMDHTMSADAPRVMSHGMSHDGVAADGSLHSDTLAGAHSGPHDGHGSSCMTCTPCSPGATLSCVLPVTSTFLSARVLPALLVTPTSVDLAHPERPPQAFLA